MSLVLYGFPEENLLNSFALCQDELSSWKNDFIITKIIFFRWSEITQGFNVLYRGKEEIHSEIKT